MHVSATAVLKWVKQYALESYEKPKHQTNNAVVIVLDVVWHCLQREKQALDLDGMLSLYL